MRRRNNVPLLFFVLLITLFRANSQGNQTAPAAVAGSESPANSQAAPQAAPTSGATPSVAAGQGVAQDAAASGPSSGSQGVSPDISPKSRQNPDSADSGVFAFRKH